jgi:hypothetical protein
MATISSRVRESSFESFSWISVARDTSEVNGMRCCLRACEAEVRRSHSSAMAVARCDLEWGRVRTRFEAVRIGRWSRWIWRPSGEWIRVRHAARGRGRAGWTEFGTNQAPRGPSHPSKTASSPPRCPCSFQSAQPVPAVVLCGLAASWRGLVVWVAGRVQ